MEEMISKYNETGQWMSFSSWLKKQVKKGVLKASKEELIQIIAMYGFLTQIKRFLMRI